MVRERGERPPVPTAPVEQGIVTEIAAPIDWWKLDSLERAETLTFLAEWTCQLANEYGLRETILPPCWYKHPAVIQELLAVYQYRNQMQFLPISPPSAPLDFHYQFNLALGRIRSWVQATNCNAREHQPSECSAWATSNSDWRRQWQIEFDSYLEQLNTSNQL